MSASDHCQDGLRPRHLRLTARQGLPAAVPMSAVVARQESSSGGCQLLLAAASIGANPLLLNEEIEIEGCVK